MKSRSACRSNLLLALVLTCAQIEFQSALAQINPASPSDSWVPILYGSNIPDPIADARTGGAEQDIVGNASHPSLYAKFADAQAPTLTSGWLGFRLRLGGDANPPGFKAVAFMGLDANRDGALDLFLGVNNQGTSSYLGIWNPGTGANTSPKTTSIDSTPTLSHASSAANYSFTPVSSVTDPNALSYDLDGNKSGTDYFLSFVFPFADVVSALATRGISGFTKDTSLQLVAATASQVNSLPQDINGIDGGTGSASTWEQLGGFTQTYTFTSLDPSVVPEPNTAASVVLGFVILLAARRRRI